MILSRYWPGWKNPLRLVKPQTVISWHRQSWRLFWRWKSKPKDYGRPNVPFVVIQLIRQMSLDNPLWGAPHIHGELKKLGYDICESTVAKYMVKRKGRSTQNWKTFLKNHLGEIAAIDFLTVPTVTFKTLYVFVVLSLDRRRVGRALTVAKWLLRADGGNHQARMPESHDHLQRGPRVSCFEEVLQTLPR